jgi:hypothetical protein
MEPTSLFLTEAEQRCPLVVMPNSNTVLIGNLRLYIDKEFGVLQLPVLTATPDLITYLLTKLGAVEPGLRRWEQAANELLQQLIAADGDGGYTLFDAEQPATALVDQEPIFTLRAQDHLAPLTVALYTAQLRHLYIAKKPTPKIIASAEAVRKAMITWQTLNPHRVKDPD